jgi:hypothetical protein
LAHKVLAPQFAEAIEQARVAFFQPIVDLEPTKLVYGRVVIIGDAAFVARPHVAMGVPRRRATPWRWPPRSRKTTISRR